MTIPRTVTLDGVTWEVAGVERHGDTWMAVCVRGDRAWFVPVDDLPKAPTPAG